MSHTQGTLRVEDNNGDPEKGAYLVDESGLGIWDQGGRICNIEDARRLAVCWNALEGLPIEFIGEFNTHVQAVAEAAAESDQWMKLCSLLLHRYALKGETVVISADEMDRMSELYPDGADLIADDGESGSVNLTLLPPGEKPSGLIVVERGKVIS